MDILVCPSSLGRHLHVKKILPIFFFTLGNFSEADVSNLDPRWRRARVDGCAWVQTGEGARRQVCPHADVCAWPQALPPVRIRLQKRWLPLGRMGLCTGIAAVQGGLFEFQAPVEEARYMKIYLHSYQTQVTIIIPCGHAKFKDTAH